MRDKFVAHSVVDKKEEMAPFLRTTLSHPALLTTIVSSSHDGMSISHKAR